MHREILKACGDLLGKKGSLLVAVDGLCCAGKTSFASELADCLGARVFHTDDFYVPSGRRSGAPGGNIDVPRLLSEILLPLKNGRDIVYRGYDCASESFGPAVKVGFPEAAVVEGTYSLLPALRGFYDIKIFMEIDPEEQTRRLSRREDAESLKRFEAVWLPRERYYFEKCRPRLASDFII